MITIMLVDDQPTVRKALRMELEMEADLRVVGEAADGEAALLLAGELRPSVVLMDIMMPVMDGLTAAARLREVAPECRVVMLSLYDDDERRREAELAGAAAFVGKCEPPDTLLAAIYGVALEHL